jgi:hypothetical protein
MALNTLERGNVAEVHWMLKRLIRFMAELTLTFRQAAQVHRMLK